MPEMPRARLRYTQREITRHGKTLWYFRRGKGPRFPLGETYGTHEFMKAYEAALGGEKTTIEPPSQKTLAWLVEKYQHSAAFLTLAPSTQRMRRNILLAVCRTGGHLKVDSITRNTIAEGRDRRASTPFAAVNFMKVMNYLFTWAVDSDHAASNPLIGVKRPKAKTRGHKAWSMEDLERYCERHPVGTKAHLALSLLLFTGVRRGDAIFLGRQHVRNGVIEYQANKNDAPLFITIPPALALSIEMAPTGDMIFLTTEWGQPFKSAASFGNWFRDRCNEADVDVRAHGLRKLAATIIADNEGSEKQLQAFFGWKSERQSGVYTKTANARRLAQSAALKLIGNDSYPNLVSGSGASAEK